jgi:acylphosphatase
VAVRYLVHGRVQGVGFRWFVLREAHRLELQGWVRNLSDGSVEVVAEGAPDSLARLAQALSRGPSGARVSHVESSDVPHEREIPNSFDIM